MDGCQEDQVTLSDKKVETSLTTFTAGMPYHFVVMNTGHIAHQFSMIPMGMNGFFFFALLQLFRVWATGSYRGRRIQNWWICLSIFMLAMGENLFGLLARGDWESQFVSMHSDDMLFVQPFFFKLFSPANFTADLTIHIAVIPVVIFGLILAHVVLIRLQGLSKPLSAQKGE
jgi:hypothetical protein